MKAITLIVAIVITAVLSGCVVYPYGGGGYYKRPHHSGGYYHR